MLNYPVEPALLARRLPAGVELDVFDGVALVSLVGRPADPCGLVST
jgi:uncharacterized protein YqjF (DUF2071 family)